jgi:hypothetical protein
MFGVSLGIIDSGGAGGGGASFESIASVTATGIETTLSFTSIPSTYKHLQIRGIAKDTYIVGSAESTTTLITFNSDTGSNYASHALRGNGTTTSGQRAASTTSMDRIVGSIFGNSTSTFGVSIVDIHDYASTTKNKTVRSFSGGELNSGDTNSNLTLGSGLWVNTSAITSIQIKAVVTAFATGSTFALYGIKG